MHIKNVLSLFDGMSCGQIALQKIGFTYDNYFASEIKPHAIQTTLRRFPETIQIGNVKNISVDAVGLYSEQNNFLETKIDLLIGGSPCQDLSNANREIKGLVGEKSSLFFQYFRILQEIQKVNPDVFFLLENVKMKKEHSDQITELLGVPPMMIDSALVSGANRKRMYWTNIPNVTIPDNLNISLQDILVEGYTDRQKALCLLESDSRPLTTPVKMFHRYFTKSFTTLIFKNEEHYNLCKKHYLENFKGLSAKDIVYTGDVYNGVRYLTKKERCRLQTLPDDYCDHLSENDASCLLGDGWTVSVIAHILSHLKNI